MMVLTLLHLHVCMRPLAPVYVSIYCTLIYHGSAIVSVFRTMQYDDIFLETHHLLA